MKSVWTVFFILAALTVILWYGIFHYHKERKEFILKFWTNQEMQIVKEAARAARGWFQIRIHEQGIPKDIVEQEVLRKFIQPILLLKNGDAWIYNRQYVIFDNSSDFPSIYRNKTIRQIFELQKKNGAFHYDKLCNGVMNATDGTGWYVWLPEKGREFVAWTSVRFGNDTWTIGLSTPESEILEYSGIDIQFRREIGGAMIITCLNFMIFLLVLRQQRHEQYAREVLEQQVRERTLQLEAANKELEGFSYMVSHSLRAPLRHIDGFCQILIEDYADSLNEHGAYQLSRIRTSVQEMGYLIDAIQRLERITREDINIEIVNLSHLAHTIAENLKQFEPERNVTFNITNGLIVQGDKRLLKVVLEELIGNAWKFTSRQEKAIIECGIKIYKNNMATYFVRDNGLGFDMAYVNKLFKPLGRLHHSHEFEGNGFGLATVERVIRRHRGQVWAEGVSGKGAVFYFVL